jgi:hypothetical protein
MFVQVLQILLKAEAFNFAVERRNFHAQKMCGTALIAVSALECIANEFRLIALHLFL